MYGGYYCIVAFTHLGNSTVTTAAPLLVTSGPVKYEVVFYSCGRSSVRGGGEEYWLVTVHTHGDFIVLPHRQFRPPAPSPATPLSLIILILSQPVLAPS